MIQDNVGKLRTKDYEVRTVDLKVAQDLVQRFHYSKGGSNTATYRHGLFKVGERECLGVAWWIPPTKSAALASYPKNWQGVLCLSRLAISSEVPPNGASFLLGRSMRAIDRERWPCLVTYADTWRNHTRAIYKATNWTYVGMTKPERTYVLKGRMIARKAGGHTRTHQEMLDLGAEMIGAFSKHKFIHIVEPKEHT